MTLGVWETPLSTIYTVLNTLYQEELVKFSEKSFDGRIRKIYEITPKGKETLKIVLEEYLKLKESITSLMTYTLGTNKKFYNFIFEKMQPFGLVFKRNLLEKYQINDKLRLLEMSEKHINQRIEELKDLKLQIEKSIVKLKKNNLEINNENS